MDEDWDVLLSFLPQDWRELAQDTGALKGLRKDKTVDNLLRTLLLHLGCGHSLRETVVRARQAHLADLSDVALLKRLKKSKGWLHALCVRLFEEQGLAVIPGGAFQVRAVDATTVKEPGPSGSLWRVHYSVGLPSLACDFFKLTGTEGPGTGESLAQFPIRAGDHVLADRGYSTARGIRHVVDAGGRLIVRVNTGSLPLCTAAGRPFDLLAAVSRSRGRPPAAPGRPRSRRPATTAARRVRLRVGSACSASLRHPPGAPESSPRRRARATRCNRRPCGSRVRDRLHASRPPPRTCWNGIACAAGELVFSASSRWPSWGTCRSR